jgi:iron complex outermembrane recepter protein
MIQKKQLAVAIAAGLVVGSFAHAQATPQPASEQPKRVERVEVTGSAIKRTDTETPAPIEIITRKDIERTGATSINELIKSIASIDIQDAGELASNSPGGSGTARVRMRGLGDTQTLVLINGRRVPVNPLADASGAGAAFNVNQLPVSAIERIEVLKDGGSAIYGADAVAGVINFILRKDFSGAQITTLYGTSSRSDGTEHGANLVVGYGDLSRNGFNILAAFDVLKRDPILRKDRDISKSVDFRRYGPIPGFNLDNRSSFAPEGNILNANGSLSGETVRPCDPANFTNNACRYDFNASLLTAYNGADRMNALVGGTINLGTWGTAYARFMGSKQEDHFEAHPVPDNFTLPDGRRYAGRFMQGGPRITDKETTFQNVDVGVDGNWKNIDFKVGFSSGTAKSTNADSNYFDRAGYNNATQNRLIDPTVLTNSQAAIDAIKISPVRTASSKLDSFDALVSGDAWKLPAGFLRYAVGANFWKETLSDQPDPRQIAGTVVGSIQQSAVTADRDAYALFAELQIPVTRTIEAQLAVRYDDYSTSKATSPKVAFKFQAIPELALRASYSESFKMPTLKQLFANAGQGAINLTESQCVALGFPAGCAGQPAFRLTGSNPNLKPEFGKNFNVGVVADAGPFSVSVDWWRIDKSDNISTPTIQSAIEQGFTRFDTETARWFIFQNLQNFAQSLNEGIDVDARWSQKLGDIGKLTLRGSMTYYTAQRTRTNSDSPWAEFNGTYGSPAWRATGIVTLERGPWTGQALIRGTAGFWDTIQPWENFGLLPAGGLRKVNKYDEVDLTVSYAGFRNLTLSGAVKNVFDRMPPFSATNATNNNYTQMGFAELYSSRGRFYQLNLGYSYR